MTNEIPLKDADLAEDVEEHGLHQIEDDVAYRRLAFVNVVLIGRRDAGDRNWVLVDTGIPGTHRQITQAAEMRFGEGARPSAIVMTHGHFDHVGELKTLAAEWDVPIYAHRFEHPFLNGQQSYAPPDTAAGGGLMSLLSPLFPRGPIDVSDRLHALPDDGSVPGLPGWRWIHTPGHSPGHVSLWREATRTLVAGDAIVTTGQESIYEAAMQTPEMHGPPAYFTPDWASAESSVRKLAALEPELIVTGHGRAMEGQHVRSALRDLAEHFQEIAVPNSAR